MNKVSRSFLVSAALATTLVGCQSNDVSTVTSNGEPSQTVAKLAPIPQMPSSDPSLPDATTVFGAQAVADKTKAMQDTSALQQEPAHEKVMTKQEESKAMPLPGQGSDDSATSLDKSKRM
jgi:hypothetical protein